MLVQFRTMSDHCRRCSYPLPPVPRLDTAPKNGRLSLVSSNGSGTVPFSADAAQMASTQPRGKTTRELTIGRRLRELREQRHLTQQDMAGRAGVPRTYISRIENARLLPGPLMLSRIAGALDVAILELLPANRNGNGNGNGNGHLSAEDVSFWTELVENFSRLSPEELSRAMFFARSLAEQSASRDFVPELVAS
jgi:transcriptional regulator with XRE-family HTH domain